MTNQQATFDFLANNKRAIKEFKDQDLIKEYNRVLMGLAKKLDEMEKAE